MLKVNLEKELKKVSDKEFINLEDAVKSTQKLLDYESAQDRKMLKTMGIDSSIRKAEDQRSSSIELKNNIKKFNGQVFTIDQIRELAIKYRLRFLRSDRYRGYVEATLPIIIKNFAKESDIDLNSAQLQYNFFILAPASAFKLDERPKPQPLDPLIFYKIDDTHYRLIHKWGNDLTVAREILGFTMKGPLNFIAMTILFPALFVLSLFISLGINVAWILLALVGIIIFSISRAIHLDEKEKFSEDTWKSYVD